MRLKAQRLSRAIPAPSDPLLHSLLVPAGNAYQGLLLPYSPNRMLLTDRESNADAGLYLLTLRVSSATNIRVGALGPVEFPSGYYVYCGSARRGLAARVRRHTRRNKKKRWHIDYLTSRRGVIVEATDVFPLGVFTECLLNAQVTELPGTIQMRGFGSSDCRCRSHLTFVGEDPPDLSILKDTVNDTRQ